jgi:hypothetical protein
MISSFRFRMPAGAARIAAAATRLQALSGVARRGPLLPTALILLLAALAAPTGLAAQDCEIRYRAGGSNNWVFLPRNAGEVWTGTVNDLREIQNVGRNDFTVRTSGVLGAIADNRLIANVGGGTIVLPPAVFTGLQLTRITCHTYATVYDAGDYLTQFGTSAAQLVADAMVVAGDAVEDAQEDAAAAFNQSVQQLRTQANTIYTNTNQTWQAFQDSVASAGGQFPAAFAQAFPELQLAIDATVEYTYGLPASTTALWTSHAQGVQQALMELDQSLGVSQTVNEIVSIDPATAFPELAALQNTRCDLDPRPLERLAEREAQLERMLRELGAAAAALWPSEIADPFFRDLWAIAVRMAEGPCQADMAALARSLQQDRAAMLAFLRNADRALRGVDVRALARGQEAFGQGIVALTNSTGQMMQLLLDQDQLEQAVEFRAVEVRQAEDRLVGPRPQSGPAGIQWLSPDYWERRARQGDPDALEADAQALVTATERYEAAVRARNDGWDRVTQGWAQWTQDAAALSGLVPQLRISVQGVDALLAALANPPVPTTPAAALREALDCVSEGLRRLRAEALELSRISARLLGALVEAFQMPQLPPELAQQLERTLQAHQAAMGANRAVLQSMQSLARGIASVNGEVVGLVGDLASDPAASNYLTRVDASLQDVREGAEELVDRRAQLDRNWSRAMDLNAERDRQVMALVDLMVPHEAARGALIGMIDELRQDVQAVQAGVQSALVCAGTLGQATTTALSAHPARLSAYVTQVGTIVAEAAGALVPPEVRVALDDALAAASALVSAYQSVAGSAATVGARAQTFTVAHAALMAAISSQDLAILPERVTAARNSAMALWEQSNTLLQARGQLNGPQNTFVARLASLQVAMTNAGLQAAWNGAGIAYNVLDLDLISDEQAKAQFVAERWGNAAVAMPTRMAALVGIDQNLVNTVNGMLQNMQNRLGQMNQCLSQGQAARTALLASSLHSQAVASATQGLQTEAQGVINDLNSLLNPTQTLMGQLATIFNRAASLSEWVSGIGSQAVSDFNTLASTSINGVNSAATCLQSGYNNVNANAMQVQSMLYPTN